MPLPNVIDGVAGSVNIVDMWKSHYNDMFNCLRNNKDVKQLNTDVHYDANIEVTHSDIISAINDLANNKSCGLDGVNAEHLKPGVHTNDFAPIHGRRARIHTAPAESTVDSTYCLPQALCEYGRADRESGRNR